MSSVIQTKYLKFLLTSVAIFQCRKMITWPRLLDYRKMFIFNYKLFFKKHVFQGRFNVSQNFFNLSLKCFLNISYKFWFTPSPKNGYLQCAQLCFFFQISSNLNLFSCRDDVYSLSMILSVCFDVKKPWG